MKDMIKKTLKTRLWKKLWKRFLRKKTWKRIHMNDSLYQMNLVEMILIVIHKQNL